MNDPFCDEHAPMLASASRLIDRLRHLHESLIPLDDVSHLEHLDFAERALSLSIYLEAALNLASRALYPASFALLRSVLEHQLTDCLLLRADRYKRRDNDVTREQWQDLESRRQSRDEGTRDIISLEWTEYENQRDIGRLTTIRSGVHERGDVRAGARTLSHMYYMLYLENYDPFQGRPDEQALLQPRFLEAAAHERLATRNRRIYRETRWDSIKENLRLNALHTEADIGKLGIHYRFLSAYTHPAPAAHGLVFGRNRPSEAPRYDHYASELCLLYLCRLAGMELHDFRAMADTEPRIDIRHWDEISDEISKGAADAIHLWFVGDRPHAYDFFEEATSRAFRDERWTRGRQSPSPDEIDPEQVRYYRNPLERLKNMHRSVREMVTGFAYRAPWERQDAGP